LADDVRVFAPKVQQIFVHNVFDSVFGVGFNCMRNSIKVVGCEFPMIKMMCKKDS